MSAPSVAVVGGGISGLVAAYRARTLLGPHADVVLVDPAALGGKLATVDVAGVPFDVGAEAFVVRRPEMVDLVAELGLADRAVAPAGRRPLLFANGRTTGLPERSLMGIPSDAESVVGLVDDATVRTVAAEEARPFAWDRDGDVSVGALVEDRFGIQVVHRSVDPMLGGVYSGSAHTASVRAAIPALAAALDAGARSLTDAVRRALPPTRPGPVFGAVAGGYRTVLDALADAAAPRVVVDAATSLRRTARGWHVDPVGEVDAVVLAVPAPDAAALLTGSVPDAAAAAHGIPLASSAVVVLALPESAPVPDNSGVLVATGETLTAKAFTFSSRKWDHVGASGVQFVRASFGKFEDPSALALPDDALVATALADLRTVTGLDGTPIATYVQRWDGGLPQYLPGHRTVVRAIEDAVAEVPRLAVAGAMMHGVGVPACVATADAAARRVVDGL